MTTAYPIADMMIGVRNMIEAADLRIGDQVLLLADTRSDKTTLEALTAGLRFFGAEPMTLVTEPISRYGDVPEAVLNAMRASDVAWHTKQWSDGFGHVIHDWFAVGRPVVGHEWYYKNQLAGPLWQEGVTSFDLTDKSPDEVAGIIDRLYNDPDLRLRMGENAAKRFREVVDFDKEEQAIRRMFEAVL